jgi:hypothetical protein
MDLFIPKETAKATIGGRTYLENTVFETLYSLDVNAYTEKKKNLTYLSWAPAWAEVKKRYPDANYVIEQFGEERLPYIYDPKTGYMVFTNMTIQGQTYRMWLPVMDENNNAMKDAPYTYEVKEYNYGKPTGKMVEKSVDAADMFNVNKTIMRCLVKNLAMFGLGLYIYAGEDLPEEKPKDETPPQPSPLDTTIAEIDAVAKDLPAKGVAKAKIGEAIKSVCGTPNYKKITEVEVAQKVLEALKNLGGNE